MQNDKIIRAKITLTNDFHGTSVKLIAERISRYQPWSDLTRGQVARAKRTLCGIDGCTCSCQLGTRGKQPINLYSLAIGERTADGFTLIETEY